MKKSNLILFTIFVLFLSSCEERIFPIGEDIPSRLVVEGIIEAGEIPTPPVVLLTRSLQFTTDGSQLSIDDLFVHDAIITVSDGEQTVTLDEICWEDLTEDQQKLVVENFGNRYDSIGVNLCVYADVNEIMPGEIGKTYTLNIAADGQELSAITTIPPHIPIDSFYFQNRPGDNSPEYFELIAKISDVENRPDFYRYFTSTNNSIFDAPLASVGDDLLFDGKEFEFPLTEGETWMEPSNAQDFGYFYVGDSITLKWCNLDEVHFNFWSTLEFNFFNQGPFGSYTRIDSNIEGGLGVWGGYSVSYYSGVVE